tara:strand:+ start:194 stop:595 length:402 start_codon:yes stop_codon:yes gene_type:complete
MNLTEKDLIVLEKDNNAIINILKKGKIILKNDCFNKEFLINIVKDLSKENFNVKYLLKFNLLDSFFDLYDKENINYNITIIDSIKDIIFDNSKNFFNELDCLIFIVEKNDENNFLKIMRKNKKNRTKKLKLKN